MRKRYKHVFFVRVQYDRCYKEINIGLVTLQRNHTNNITYLEQGPCGLELSENKYIIKAMVLVSLNVSRTYEEERTDTCYSGGGVGTYRT